MSTYVVFKSVPFWGGRLCDSLPHTKKHQFHLSDPHNKSQPHKKNDQDFQYQVYILKNNPYHWFVSLYYYHPGFSFLYILIILIMINSRSGWFWLIDLSSFVHLKRINLISVLMQWPCQGMGCPELAVTILTFGGGQPPAGHLVLYPKEMAT